jgi:hypothetical protein
MTKVRRAEGCEARFTGSGVRRRAGLAQELAGMRLEHHGARALAQFLGEVAGAAKHRLMSAMNAIEIADGEHCAFCLRRHIPPTGDDIHPSFLDERAIACAI